jgi:hypothetical protein
VDEVGFWIVIPTRWAMITSYLDEDRSSHSAGQMGQAVVDSHYG